MWLKFWINVSLAQNESSEKEFSMYVSVDVLKQISLSQH